MKFAIHNLQSAIGTACLLLSLLVPVARAQLPAAVGAFDEGNRHYLAGDYGAALEAYERAVTAEYVSGALFYNMGNAYYRLDELGQAIRYYEKARPLMPENPELQHNLETARARTADRFSQLPLPFWTRRWQWLVLHVGAPGLFLAGLVLYTAAAALIGYRIWTGRRSPWHRRARTLSLLAGLLLLTLAFAASLDRTLSQRAVVVAERVAMRPSPTPDAAPALNIHEGLVLHVLGTRQGWTEVRLPNGTTGWIQAETVAPI